MVELFALNAKGEGHPILEYMNLSWTLSSLIGTLHRFLEQNPKIKIGVEQEHAITKVLDILNYEIDTLPKLGKEEFKAYQLLRQEELRSLATIDLTIRTVEGAKGILRDKGQKADYDKLIGFLKAYKSHMKAALAELNTELRSEYKDLTNLDIQVGTISHETMMSNLRTLTKEDQISFLTRFAARSELGSIRRDYSRILTLRTKLENLLRNLIVKARKRQPITLDLQLLNTYLAQEGNALTDEVKECHKIMLRLNFFMIILLANVENLIHDLKKWAANQLLPTAQTQEAIHGFELALKGIKDAIKGEETSTRVLVAANDHLRAHLDRVA